MDALPSSPEQVVELAVNLDDVSPQVVADAQRRLLEAGALDAWTVAIGMKKQRPGVMLCVLADATKRDALAERLLELTGSFGLRMRRWDRLVLERRHETVQTRWGPVRIKVGSRHGRVLVASPEHDDVQALAEQARISFREALDAARAAADQWLHQTRHTPPT